MKHYLFLMHLLVNCDHVRLCEKRNFINLTRDIIVSILFPTRSNMRTFERIVKCITESGDVYKLTSMMKAISYIRHFEPNYARNEQPNDKFTCVVLKSFKYFIQTYENERSELEAFTTMCLSVLYANFPSVRETYCRFTSTDSWNKLTKMTKTKYMKIGSVGNNKLYMFISPLNSCWIH